MAYNPNILKEALQARRLTTAQLSQKLGIDPTELNRELRRTPEPKQGFLKVLAHELVLPPFVFYMKHLPALEEAIPDFRSTTPEIEAKSRQTIEAIKLADGIQQWIARLQASPASNLPKFTASTDKDIDRFALKAREYFAITLKEQQEAKNSRAFYLIIRRKIEEKGIIVLQKLLAARGRQRILPRGQQAPIDRHQYATTNSWPPSFHIDTRACARTNGEDRDF